MGQGDQVEIAAVSAERKRSADNFVQLLEGKKLRDGKFAHRDDQQRAQKIDLVIQPGRTIPDFIRRRNAVTARGRLAREATADGGEINLRTHLGFIQMAEFIEPAKEGAAGCPGERSAQNGFSDAGCLPDQDDAAKNRSSGDRRWEHPRTTPALA